MIKTEIRHGAIGLLTLALAGVSQASPTVYIPLGSANRVIAVDAATNQITASYPGTTNPHGLVATPDGEYLVSGSLNETPPAKGQPADANTSRLYLIHPAHGHVMAEIPVAGWTHHQAITPDGRYVISTHTTRGYITVVDLQSNQVVKTIKTGLAPNYTVISADGKRAYVSNTGSGSISEVDLAAGKVVRSLQAGPAPERGALSLLRPVALADDRGGGNELQFGIGDQQRVASAAQQDLGGSSCTVNMVFLDLALCGYSGCY